MDTITYPYKPKLWLMLLVLVFFGGLTAVMVNEAMTNQRGLVLNGILNFNANGATVFYWVLGAVSLTFAGLGLIGIRRAVQAPRQITLDATAISAPKSLASRKIIHVPYDTIIGLEFQTVQKQHFLNIHHNAGKLSIAASGLADVATLENIAQELQARIA